MPNTQTILGVLLLALLAFCSAPSRADDTDLSAFQTAAAPVAIEPFTLPRNGHPDPNHIGPLWAAHLKQEKALRLAENRALDQRRLDEKAAREQAAAKVAEDARFHDFAKADGSDFGEYKIKSLAQGTLTLIDRGGEPHKIIRSDLSDEDQPFIDLWIRNAATKIVRPPTKTVETAKSKPAVAHSPRR